MFAYCEHIPEYPGETDTNIHWFVDANGRGGERVYDTAGEWDTTEMPMGYTSLINCHRLIPSPYHLP